jgi:purine-binding chemotaxis protein CheW
VTTAAVILPIGEDLYAIAADTVREVVSSPQPTRLPTAPSVLLGAFNLRGEMVPLFDTAALLGVGKLADASLTVVVNTAAGPAGLVVSGLPRIALLDAELGPSELRGTLGVYKVGDAIAVLVDIEALIFREISLATSLTDASVGR